MKENKNNSNVKLVLIFLVITIVVFGSGVGITYLYFKYNPNSVEQITNITKTEKEVTVTDEGIADAVEKVYDAVTYIVNYKDGKAYSSGTGFVYKKDENKYFILTNYHVINGSSSLSVEFNNGELFTAKLVGGDKYTDTAVLSIETDKELPVSEIGSSKNTRIGDTVFAVGTPISTNYAWSVTRGVLSGKDRTITVNITNSSNFSDNVTLNVLQTDVAINSGNSGGPLCNSNGEVIGITSSKVTASGVSGIGFAIPIEDALDIANKVENGEEITRPYIGLEMSELIYAQYFGYVSTDLDHGIFVTKVFKDSPASKAGIKEEDVILELNETKITSVSQFRYQLYKNNIGEVVKIKINRNGTEKNVELKLGSSS